MEQDKEKFNENLHEGSRGETLFFSEEDVQFMFYDLDLLEKLTVNGREQIRVGVQYAKKIKLRMELFRIKVLPTSLLKTNQENGVLKI
ncbi:hypothetical protein [Paenibacillus donghaensis]|uniref:hypothetical protein n=1 Tax=Paenibacillus donghaensis TaxID=414771 RepID=UPI0012FD8930|nr:hypothetical protein [Paenibacillus donghaensis]